MKLILVTLLVIASAFADVSELPSSEYLPPQAEEAPQQSIEVIQESAAVEAEPAHELADDGYRYKTVKRYRFRHRRDVSELPSSEYLPPQAQEIIAEQPAFEAVQDSIAVEAEPAHELADDGYRYKTVKRYRFRHRRDVSELPSSEYLPPQEVDVEQPAIEVHQEAVAVEAEPAHELADDGYRYKTVKRYRFRHRRDVSELPSSEYLPPQEVDVEQPAIDVRQEAVHVEAEPAHELADDGYRYKTVKRYRFRHRRDVSELPSSEYLPPQAQDVAVEQPAIEIVQQSVDVEAEPAHELADDGYRYKTVKRYRFRHRRDVSELPSSEYLPPQAQEVAVEQPAVEVVQEAVHVEAEPAHELADDGYRYKTVKRYRFRHRRDVSELPSSEYLPPQAQEVAVEQPAIEIVQQSVDVEAEPAHELADDGYRYKTVKRYRFRHRRDVSELPSSEYLPPQAQEVIAEQPANEAVHESVAVEVEPAHELADDGYRYKTVKRYRYRHR